MKTFSLSKTYSRLLIGAGLAAFALLLMAAPSSARADTLYRQLELGMSGADVGSLQAFLAQDKTLYPQGLVTSYFGFLTKSAVANFQSRNGIAAVGRVGPATLPVINAQMSGGTAVNYGGNSMNSGGDIYAPTIANINVGVSTNAATVSWNTNENARGVVYYSVSPLSVSEQLNSVTISGATAMSDAFARTSQSVGLPGLMSQTTYYYMIYSTDEVGNVTVTWPSTFRTN
jgi:peptidoglycan hydrolase-like protein with peptidoglycan-binding domain